MKIVVMGFVIRLILSPVVSPTPNRVTTILIAFAQTLSPASHIATANPIFAPSFVAANPVLLSHSTAVALLIHHRFRPS